LPYAHRGHCKDEDSYKECSSHVELSIGLIGLEFRIEDGRIGVMQGTVVSTPTKNKPKLLDQRVKASLTRQE